ncbi:hypothetical protein VM57_16285 [Stenotrophomonas maltophilia]|uniref:Uncharacterized protein n=1 Tax=Stenotrophomonas maltophilia TaxID=40324 RepID=A0A0F5ZMM1_STEMA|nr:hypothetical protein VM57_16285 [Stenotrophomonas maltophilia]
MVHAASACSDSDRNWRWASFQYGASTTSTSVASWCSRMKRAMPSALASRPSCRNRLVMRGSVVIIVGSGWTR